MNVTETVKETKEIIKGFRQQGFTVGLVPTMGHLHQGHVSLMQRSSNDNTKTVVSIFVNPKQFGPNEDFEKYPRDVARDTKICKEANVDLIFTPSVSEMYPSDSFTFVDIDMLGNRLCGEKRPGHFKGVCTVVSKLFNIITPNRAYFGEKDAQQLAIIKNMTRDLNFDIDIVSCPIIREQDGLAMSSRNIYLTPEERSAALVISKSLLQVREKMMQGERNAENIKRLLNESLLQEPSASMDYVEVVDAFTLQPIARVEGQVLVAVAVYIGKTRLIDNFSFEVYYE